MHTIVKQPCSSSTMNHATSCEIIVRKRKIAELNYIQNGATTKNWSRSNAFFLAIHVFFLQCMFLKVLAPIRPRYGPDTVPIRPRYGPDMAPIWPRYGPDTAPIRPRYGPATGPIRPRYGHRSAFFQKFNRQRLAFFEKIRTILRSRRELRHL